MSCSCLRRCLPWQGKFISRSGRTTEITDLNGRKYKVYPLSQTSYGEPDGLFGINCGHRPRGVSDGLFTKTSKTSEEYGADDEELYYKVCKQRELERKARKSKTEADMLDAAGDSEGARAVRQKANQYNKELKGYCQQNGLKYRSDRVRTYGAIEPKKITVPKPTRDNSQFYKQIIVDEKRKALPNICVVSHDEMGGAPAAFNALHNALYLDDTLLDIEKTA